MASKSGSNKGTDLSKCSRRGDSLKSVKEIPLEGDIVDILTLEKEC